MNNKYSNPILCNFGSGHDKNVQSDWTSTDTTSDTYILHKPTIEQTTGTSTTDVMSQNAVTNAIGDLVIPAVLQETGTSTTDVMSQKATTDSILNPDIASGNRVKINSTTPIYSGATDITLIDSHGTTSVADSSILIGCSSYNATGSGLISIGLNSRAGSSCIAIGNNSMADSSQSVTVGANSYSMSNGVSVGDSITTYSGNCVNVGTYSGGTTNSVSLGYDSKATTSAYYSVSLGANSRATEASTVSVGDGSSSTDYGTRRIVNVKDPTNAQDAATKNYVDGKSGTLTTNNSTSQAVPETAESFTADIDLHKISKTGTFSDLLSIPTTLSGYGITDGATSTYVDGKVEDSIVDGHTTIAPSGNAVYDALALKLDKTSTGTTRRVYGVDATDLQELTEVETTPTDSSTKLITSGGVKTALDLKAPLASPAFTGIPTGIRQDFTATLPYASWTGSSAPYTKAVTVTGILSTDKPDINLDLSSATYSDVATIQSDWANVYRGVTSADTITFYASTVPTIDIPLEIKVVR